MRLLLLLLLFAPLLCRAAVLTNAQEFVRFASVPLLRQAHDHLSKFTFEAQLPQQECKAEEGRGTAPTPAVWPEFQDECIADEESQRLALVDLYEGTGGDQWTDASGWFVDDCFCEWHGVVCAVKNATSSGSELQTPFTVGNSSAVCGPVIGLFLHQNNLIGTIPDSIEDLSCLQFLYLSNNELSGVFPRPVLALDRLQQLMLDGNQLRGTIPDDVGSYLPDLVYLNLGFNAFRGTLPSSLGNMTRLELLFVNNNGLSGTIPRSFERLRALTSFSVSLNAFTGTIPDMFTENMSLFAAFTCGLEGTLPPSLALATDLQYLLVYENHLHGGLPDNIGAFSQLISFDVSVNNLSFELPDCSNFTQAIAFNVANNTGVHGSIPESVGKMTSVQLLGLNYCSLSGTIPESVGNMSSLVTFVAAVNQLEGTLPASLGNILGLKEISVFQNKLRGVIPEEWSQLRSMQALFLSYNKLTGTMPAFIGSWRLLLFLGLDENRLVGELPDLGKLIFLYRYSIGGNLLSGTIPDSLSRMISLGSFTAFNNRFSGTLPSSLGTQSVLKTLDLSYNQFHGTIPDGISRLVSLETLLISSMEQVNGSIPDLSALHELKTLSLQGMSLSGPIPESLCGAGALETLFLNFNELSGPIPACVGGLSQLRELVLNANMLQGSIPESLGKLSNLVTLNLRENQLEGTIPGSLSHLTRVTLLSLAANRLNGTIPAELSRMEALMVVYLEDNDLTGTIPEELANSRALVQFNVRNNRLTGTIPAAFANQQYGSIVGSRHIAVLDFTNNDLSGSLPKMAFALPEIYYINIQKNAKMRSDELYHANRQSKLSFDEGHYACSVVDVPSGDASFYYDQSYFNFSPLYCHCESGYFGTPPVHCEPCLENGQCPGTPFVLWHEGFYPVFEVADDTSSAVLGFVECEEEEVCNPQGTCRYNAELGVGGCELCEEGHTGRLCAQCVFDDEECYYHSGEQCVKGELPSAIALTVAALVLLTVIGLLLLVESATVLFFAEAAVVVFLVMAGLGERWLQQLIVILGLLHLLMALSKVEVSTGTIKSFLFFMQTTGVINEEVISWDKISSDLAHLEIESISLSGIKCMSHTIFGSDTGSFLFDMMIPFMLIAAAAFLVAGHSWGRWLMKRFVCKSGEAGDADDAVSHHAHAYAEEDEILVTSLPSYSGLAPRGGGVQASDSDSDSDDEKEDHHSEHDHHPLTIWQQIAKATLFLLFACYFELSNNVFEVFNCNKEEISGRWYNEAEPYLQCSFDSEWGTLFWLALAFGVLYVIGIPLLFVALIWIYRKRLYSHVVESVIGFLYEDYRESVFWFEAVWMARRLLLSAFAFVMTEQSTVRFLLIVLVMVGSLLLQHFVQPFKHDSVNHIEFLSLIVILGTYACQEMMVHSDGWEKVVYSVVVFGANGVIVMAFLVLLLWPFLVKVVRVLKKKMGWKSSHKVSLRPVSVQ